MKFIVAGCIQGRGMDADKFYNVVREYEANNTDEAREKAEEDNIWVEKVIAKEKK